MWRKNLKRENPKPHTQNPKPHTQNPKPHTLNPKPYTMARNYHENQKTNTAPRRRGEPRRGEMLNPLLCIAKK